MAVVERHNPALSVHELALLFEDHPTVALVTAICEQIIPSTCQGLHRRTLLKTMYQLPAIGNLPDEFDYWWTDEHERVLELGLDLWKQGR